MAQRVCGGVFAVHPLRAESVAWISERKDVLSGLFFMLTLWAYVRYAACDMQNARGTDAEMQNLLRADAGFLRSGAVGQEHGGDAAVCAVAAGLLAAGKNENANSESECRIKRRAGMSESPFWGLVREKIPLFVAFGGSCVAAALVPGLMCTCPPASILERFGNALVSYVVYLRQMIFPAGLAVPYPIRPAASRFGRSAWRCCCWPRLRAGVVACRKKRPCLLTGWLWYLGMLVPVIGIIQISARCRPCRPLHLSAGNRFGHGGDLGGGGLERRLETSAAGFGRFDDGGDWRLEVCAHIQTSYWRDGESLWTHTLACTSSNCIAISNLAAILVEKGANWRKPSRNTGKALEIKPDYAEAHNNLGNALFNKGDKEAAIAQFRKALEIMPDDAKAHYNLGIALFGKGESGRGHRAIPHRLGNQARLSRKPGPTWQLLFLTKERRRKPSPNTIRLWSLSPMTRIPAAILGLLFSTRGRRRKPSPNTEGRWKLTLDV